MILVDTSVWIDYFRGTETPQAEMLDSLLCSTGLTGSGRRNPGPADSAD